MGKYTVTEGVIPLPVRVVVYGPEGIGKTTFASRFPDPVFIDTEGGSGRLSVRRMPNPNSWAMLLDEVLEVAKGGVPCGTLVVDTADWAERLCIRAVCDKAQVKGIEDFGYGKGYVYVKEEFGRLLDALDEVRSSGRHIVVTAHAQITKFEQPDEMGAYDRWSMKTSKQVAPLLREWCDMLLFANYKTIVVRDGEGKNAKSKAQGGRRVMYTSHHPCWDAKNRFGLAAELPFEYESIVSAFGFAAPAVNTAAPAAEKPSGTPILVDDDPPVAAPVKEQAPAARTQGVQNEFLEKLDAQLAAQGIPENLRKLMAANNVGEDEIQKVVGERGYFPADMPVKDYPRDFVDGCLVGAWSKVLEMIVNNRDVPF